MGSLTSLPGLVLIVGGGFLVGFGTRYANGCTSGHAISGLAALRVTSLVAVLGFFAGGLLSTHVLLPLILGGGFLMDQETTQPASRGRHG